MSLKNKRLAKGITIEKSNTERDVTLSIEHDAANALENYTVKVPAIVAGPAVTMELPEEGTKLLSDTNTASIENKTIDATLNDITNLEIDSSNIDSGVAANGQVLTADGTGGTSWTNAGSGAALDLSNLVSTSINQDLLPDTNNTRDLGSAGETWNQGFIYEVRTDVLDTVSGVGAITLASTLNTNLNPIENLPTPINAADAANKDYVDTEISDLASDVATNLSTALLDKISVDGSIAFTDDQSMGGNALTNVLDPVNNQDAATKAYVDNYVTTSKVANYGISISGSGVATNSTTTLADVPNLSTTITVQTGNPVLVTLIPDMTDPSFSSYIGITGSSTNIIGDISILRNGTLIKKHRLSYFLTAGGFNNIFTPVGSVTLYDTPGVGFYTYKVQFRVETASSTCTIAYAKLLVREL
jgi:hypothetical protein